MKTIMKCECEFKAILSNVDETIVGNLNFGNGYIIKKEKMFNLCEDFDYTDFGIRRVYESSKLSDSLDVAVLYKKVEFEASNYEDYCIKSNEIVNDEIQYIDEKMRLVRLFSNNSFNIKNLAYIEKYDSFVSHGRVPFPDKINKPIKLHLDNADEISRINNFINNYDISYSNSNYDKDLLIKAGMLYDSTYTSTYPILCFMCGVIALESLLGDSNNKTEISYRLSRNCGMLLANNVEEYKKIKKDIKKLYNLRSEFVHCGIVGKITDDDLILVRDYLRKVMFKIVDLNIAKDELIDNLDLRGLTEEEKQHKKYLE